MRHRNPERHLTVLVNTRGNVTFAFFFFAYNIKCCTDLFELQCLSLWICLDHTPVTSGASHLEVIYYKTIQMSLVVCRMPSLLVPTSAVQHSASAAPCVWVCRVTFFGHALALFSISFFCLQKSLFSVFLSHKLETLSESLKPGVFCHSGNLIKTECLFCLWILSLAAATHLCWEPEKHEFQLRRQN